MSRSVVAAMTAYTLELREAEVKLNQNESPFDLPRALKERVLARVAERPWNLYPDFESRTLREAIAKSYGFTAENIHVGNGSNELLAATIATFVGPGTTVAIPRPTFTLYEKLVTIAGGVVIPIDIDPSTGFLPLDAMLRANAAPRSSSIARMATSRSIRSRRSTIDSSPSPRSRKRGGWRRCASAGWRRRRRRRARFAK